MWVTDHDPEVNGKGKTEHIRARKLPHKRSRKPGSKKRWIPRLSVYSQRAVDSLQRASGRKNQGKTRQEGRKIREFEYQGIKGGLKSLIQIDSPTSLTSQTSKPRKFSQQ